MKIHKSVLSLATAHFFIDTYSSMLGAFLPFLNKQLNLSLAEAGILGGALVFSSALMQPFYGYLADRLRHKVFAALGPGIAGVFISSLGLAADFYTLLGLLVLGGIGVAAFHPQGAAITAEVSRDNHGSQMSFFIAGGMVGYALGPIYITSIITLAGLTNSYWAALPGLLMSGYLLCYGPSPKRLNPGGARLALFELLHKQLKPIVVLYVLVVLRSVIQVTFTSFLPLYWTMQGYTEVQGSQFLTLFLLAGGSAAFLGGTLSDRFGEKPIMIFSMLGCFPLLIGFLWTRGPWSILLCAAGGAFLLFTSPVTVVMAQKLIPRGVSTVSALVMGFAWGVGGLFIPLVGIFGDFFGLQITLTGLVLLMLPGSLLSLALPSQVETDRFVSEKIPKI